MILIRLVFCLLVFVFFCFLFFVLLFPLYPHPLLIFQNPAGIIYLWQAVNRGGADVFRALVSAGERDAKYLCFISVL